MLRSIDSVLVLAGQWAAAAAAECECHRPSQLRAAKSATLNATLALAVAAAVKSVRHSAVAVVVRRQLICTADFIDVSGLPIPTPPYGLR